MVSDFNLNCNLNQKLRTRSKDVRVRRKSKETKSSIGPKVNSKLGQYKVNINTIGKVAESNQKGKKRAEEIKQVQEKDKMFGGWK